MSNVSTTVEKPEWPKRQLGVLLRGAGQVMFQDSPWTGLLFLAGIFWGAYAEGLGVVAWGALVGLVVSTAAGYVLKLPKENGAQGLWGFNGILVGCAFPTFMGNTIWMWLGLILCSAMSTWVRSGFNKVMAPWGINSLTFPFVFCTWVFLLAARQFSGMPPTHMSTPEIAYTIDSSINLGFCNLVVYWLKGISQVFLINCWVTGIFFLVALAVCSWRSCLWAAIASAVSLFIAIVWEGPGGSIESGLYGFSAVLTGIALGATFCRPGWKTAVWTLLGIVVTVFIQAGMNSLLYPLGLATLTGPFCVATWLMLLPQYKWFLPKQG